MVGSGCYLSVVRADSKARWRLAARLAPVAVTLVIFCGTAQSAPTRPTSLMASGQVVTYGERDPSCQPPLTLSYPANGSRGNYAMCCREFKPLLIFPEELVEVKVKLYDGEDRFQIKLEDGPAHLFVHDGPAKAGVQIFRNAFPKDDRERWAVTKLCIVAAGDYTPSRIEVLSAQVIGGTCTTIRRTSTLPASDAGRWARALDANGLRTSDTADLAAVVRVTRAPGDGPARTIADVDLRTRDGVAATGHGQGDDAIAGALAAVLAQIRAATTEVAIHATPSQARIEVTEPIVAQGTPSLMIGCIAATATITGRVVAPGYMTHTLSLRAADNREPGIDLIPLSVSRPADETIWTPSAGTIAAFAVVAALLAVLVLVLVLVTTGTELGLYLQERVAGYSKSNQTPDFGVFLDGARGEMTIPLATEMSELNRAIVY